MKKILAIVFTIVMVFSMSVIAFAADDTVVSDIEIRGYEVTVSSDFSPKTSYKFYGEDGEQTSSTTPAKVVLYVKDNSVVLNGKTINKEEGKNYIKIVQALPVAVSTVETTTETTTEPKAVVPATETTTVSEITTVPETKKVVTETTTAPETTTVVETTVPTTAVSTTKKEETSSLRTWTERTTEATTTSAQKVVDNLKTTTAAKQQFSSKSFVAPARENATKSSITHKSGVVVTKATVTTTEATVTAAPVVEAIPETGSSTKASAVAAFVILMIAVSAVVIIKKEG